MLEFLINCVNYQAKYKYLIFINTKSETGSDLLLSVSLHRLELKTLTKQKFRETFYPEIKKDQNYHYEIKKRVMSMSHRYCA